MAVTLSLLFWVIVIVAVVFGVLAPRDPRFAPYAPWPVFLLVIILGIAVFGFHLTR